MSPRERVEVFQLLFVRLLVSQLDDRTLVTLKGGGNLRFFFGSPRFSEVLDFDVRHIATRTLQKKVDGLLGGTTLARLLLAKGLRIDAWSAPKQTELVQRWKASLVEGESIPESTKFEFSRRKGAGDGSAVDPIPAGALERHQLAGPVLAAHYGADAAAAQKVEALLGRSAPQSRDVFDLNLLLDRGARLPDLPARSRREAVERALGFSRDEFEDQVLAYLEPEEADALRSAAVIEALQVRVADALEATA